MEVELGSLQRSEQSLPPGKGGVNNVEQFGVAKSIQLFWGNLGLGVGPLTNSTPNVEV